MLQKQAEEAANEDTEKVKNVEPTEEVETRDFENYGSESEPSEKVRKEFCPDDVYCLAWS